MKEIELKKLGENIKRLRKARGMNQTALAQHAQTRPTTISSIEKGSNKNPGWDLLDRIAGVLNTSIHQLTEPGSDLVDRKMGVPNGLKDLMQKQDDLLALGEPRISLNEVEWLANVPPDNGEEMSAEQYLIILRHYRLVTRTSGR